MKCIGIIQARTRSTRLPGKVLAEIEGRPLLTLLLDRLRRGEGRAARLEWWVATSDQPEDDALADTAGAAGARVYRGDADDVLERFAAIARLRQPTWILRATGDNPFADAPLVECLLSAADREEGGDEGETDLWTQPLGALPLGYGLQLARTRSLLESEQSLPDTERFHRAHVLTWLSAKGRVREFALPASWPRRPAWRWTIDTACDLEAARAAFAVFGNVHLEYSEMVRCLDRHPAIAAANSSVRQKRPEEG